MKNINYAQEFCYCERGQSKFTLAKRIRYRAFYIRDRRNQNDEFVQSSIRLITTGIFINEEIKVIRSLTNTSLIHKFQAVKGAECD